MKHRRTILAIAVTVALSLSPKRSMACSCGENPPPPEALAQATAVFSGRVVAGSYDKSVYTASVRILGVWKGSVSEPIEELLTHPQCCLCGLVLEKGQDYLIYAYENDGHLWVSTCSRTVLLDQAAADLSALGEPLRSYPPE